MIKYLLATAALVVAGVPAAVGLAGNASFTRDVPVRVPLQAQTTTPSSASTADDDGTADRGRGGVEPGDDRSGDVPRARRTETGDDHGGAIHHAEPGDDRGDDHGGTSGRDSSDDSTHSTTAGSSHDSGDDHGGTSDSGSSGSGSSGSSASDDGSHGGDDSSGSGSSGSGPSDDGSGHH